MQHLPRDPRPNVLLILTDQQRFDTISALTNHFDVHTPGMDSLAERGVSFDNAYCTAPVCGPSRGTIMTGFFPSQTGVFANLGNPCGPLVESIGTIGNRMQALGYQTVYHGKWHLGGDIARYGFEIAEECSHDATTVQKASCFYRDRDWLNHKRPFFHIVSLLNPHDVYFLEPDKEAEPTLPRWANQDDTLEGKPWPQSAKANKAGLTDGRIEYYRRFYAEKVEKVDRQIVELLDEMTCGGYAPNTFVIFTSDHGDMAGEHGIPFKGSYMYDGVTRVPLIISPPRADMLGSTACPTEWRDCQPGHCEALTSHIDLVPTIIDIAGGEPVDGLPGRSLLPAMRGEALPQREAVFAEWHVMGDLVTPIRMARDTRYKYNHYLGIGEELYDLQTDPAELHNLADSADHADVLERMRGLVKRHCETTSDPFFSLTPSEKPD